ncbi:MAG: DUF4139 domain-containing protein [Pseudomonadota bacterium]
MQQTVVKNSYLNLIIVIFSLNTGYLSAGEVKTTIKDQQEISLTVYNQNFALIRDVRKVNLQKGKNTIAVREVSALIRPETAILNNLTRPDSMALIEQNFDYDLLTPQHLLQKYVGKQVRIIKTHPTSGAEQEVEATVLSANNGVVLKIGDRIETGVPGRIVYDKVPDNLRDRPTLSVVVDNQAAGSQLLELSYLSGGLNWQADYVAKLSENEQTIDINGWVTLRNESGASYKNAQLQLVAGDVNKVKNPQAMHSDMLVMESRAAAQKMQEEALFEYHLYTLGHKTDLMQNQKKQVALLSATEIPVKKEFLLQGQPHHYYKQASKISDKQKVAVYIEFENKSSNELGMPLPKGIVRVYKDDSEGSAQFIGEDQIDHTPKDETVRLKLGDAFDVTATKKQTSYEKKGSFGKYKHSSLSAYEIEIHNAKEEDVTVKVLESVPGDWEIEKSNLAYNKANAHLAEWDVDVPAGQRVKLEYEVLVRY